MEETLGSTNTYTKQQWIAEQARVHPEPTLGPVLDLRIKDGVIRRMIDYGRALDLCLLSEPDM